MRYTPSVRRISKVCLYLITTFFRKKSYWCKCLFIIGILGAVPIAFGQSNDNPISSKNTDTADVERVEVIGSHAKTFQYQLPSTVQTFDVEALSQRNITSSLDLVSQLANVTLRTRNPMNSSFAIRGVGGDNWHINANQGVKQLVDGFEVQGAYAASLAMFDVRSAEVHRGPQNGNFGVNSSGGIINFNTELPDYSSRYVRLDARVGYENFQQYTAVANLPLTEKLATRVSIFSRTREPLWLNTFDNTETGDLDKLAYRAHIQYQQSSKASWLLTIYSGEDNSSRVPYLGIGFWDPNGSNVVNGTIVNANAPIDCPQLLPSNSASFETPSNCLTLLPFSGNQGIVGGQGDWYTTFEPIENVNRAKFDTARFSYQHDLDFAVLEYRFAYDDVETNYLETLSNNPAGLAFMPGQASDKRHRSHEVRLNDWQVADQHRLSFGVLYSNANDNFDTIITRTDQGGAPFGIVPSVLIEQKSKVLSTYFAHSYEMSDSWLLSANLRYTDMDFAGISTARVMAKTLDGTPSGTPIPLESYLTRMQVEEIVPDTAGVCPPPIGGLPCELASDVEQRSYLLGGDLTASYFFSDNYHIYAKVARGFLAGAFDTRALAAFAGTADQPVNPETVNAAEIGVKWNSPTMSGQAAVFHYTWKDKQTFDVNNLGQPAFLNIPAAELSGFEIDVNRQFDENWSLTFNFGFLDSEITDAGTLIFTTEGNELTHIPDTSYALGLHYQIEWAKGITKATLQTHHKDSVFDSADNSQTTKIEAQGQWSAFVQHDLNSGSGLDFSFFAGVKNLSAEKQCLSYSANGALSYTIQCRPNSGKAEWYVGVGVTF